MTQTAASTPTILVVEDEPLVRLVATLLLSDSGFNVVEACNAEEALQMLERSADIRIVFTDVEMPGRLDGFGLARCIHERWPAIGVVITSGRCRPQPNQTGAEELFVSKPYGIDALMSKIQSCLSAVAVAA